MAQAPTSRKLGLTRDQLATFLGDHEQIKQFENLFATVDSEVAPTAVTDATTLAQTAYAVGNEALAGVATLNALVAPLVTAPPPTGGTVTSVAASGGTTGLTFTGSPITTSGTFTLGGILAVTHGGTGANNPTDARTNLGAAKSGANSDITSMSGLTGGIATPDYIDFDTTATVARATGRLWWDNADGIQTLNLGMAGTNATLQIGEEMYFRIKASSAITEGQVVMFTGTVGNSGALTGAPATGLTKDTASYVMGVATEDIPNNGWGYVTQFGLVRGINTTGGAEAWVDGQILYYNPAVPGGLTKTVPTAPAAKVEVAAVIKAASNGSLFIRPVARFSLTQLNDVESSAAANLDLLQYNGSIWQHKSPTTISVGTATNLAGGAANQIPYQTGAGATGFITAPTVANTFLEWSGSAFQWSLNPLGTVTSVNVAGGTTGLTFSGGPITTSGTITMAGTLGVANGGTGVNSLTAGRLVKGNGTSAVSASIVYDDGTNIGIGGAPAFKLDVFGDVRVSSGGDLRISSATGTTTSAGDTVFYSDANDLNVVVNGTLRYNIGSAGQFGIGGANYGTSGQVLTSQGASSAPVWATPTNGTVTSVSGTGSVNGITLTGTVTSSGSLTLGGTLSGVSLTTQVSGTLPIANGGTGATDAATARSNLGAGTVTSVGGTGSVNGITLTGTVTSSGSLTLGGTLSGVSLTTQVTGTLPVGNGGTGATTLSSGYLLKGNGTSAVTASILYDSGLHLGVNVSSPSSGYSGSTGSSMTFKNTSSVIWQNSSGSWNTTTAGGAITYWSDNNLYIDAKDSASNIIFRVNGDTEAARFNSNRKLLVNTTTETSASVGGYLQVGSEIVSKGSLAGFFWENRSGGVTSNSNWYGWYTSAGTIYLYNGSANIASINSSTGAYTALSDRDKKCDFEESNIGLDAILALKPAFYRMKGDPEDAPKQLWLVAQEVQDHIPAAYVERVMEDASGNPATFIGLDEKPIIAALIKAVQELTERVAQLEGK